MENKYTYSKKHFIVAVLVALGVIIVTVSLSYAQEVLPKVLVIGDSITLNEVQQPKAKFVNGSDVVLDFPVKITNFTKSPEAEATFTLTCVKSTSTQTVTVKKSGKNTFNYIHPLTKEEVLFLDELKKTKKTTPCEFSAVTGGTGKVTFDLYRNKVRVDIKNIKKAK